ncbi:density-regulated protein homolog [Lingula anatina]|uniref:Density-regulated protein n=1 Tax=Lingula anatina TaxID=7574 RepID=A0A1S3HGJ1_LINAN|nr:density-regulated protein homolog [Lingula anatina]XP_013384587.1 density-regulated protein homolog [Lingula anatina]XP_013384588.1 density-regulated protein homolog [Lingula anatina]XP_013384589.1 density-regulated protein homolog [Lingula anatina]XP_013384590.1 density-regulated protein homolog [Lingula anatina]XP_013384591.1 density-regulated protein homolog [Lingula anatina]|eukprot:XP_013384586.1 density-regulated protein homolog [Lingula anatina]
MASEAVDESRFLVHEGPKPGVSYPLHVDYCPECSMPFEYCENGPSFDKCKKWLQDNLPEEFERLHVGEGDEGKEGEEKKRQKRGGRGVPKSRKKAAAPQSVCLSRASRGKKKYVTVVTGLATYEIDLKDASKCFGSKFACGSSVTGDDEIVIQGDVKDELFDFITEKWPQISEDNIDDLGDLKR